MRQSAYPEIGQRITISQGKAAAAQACFAQEGASRAPWVLSGNFTGAPSCFQWVGTPFSSMFREQFRQTLADIGEHFSLILQPHSFSHLKRPRRRSGFLRSSAGSVLPRNLARKPEASVSQNSREEHARPKKVGGLYSMCPREAGLCGNHTLVIFDKRHYHVRKGPCAFWRSTRPAARRQSRSWKAAGLSRSR
jgi:hypothetical protein